MVIPTPKTEEEAEAALAADGKSQMVAATYADVLRQHREGTEYKELRLLHVIEQDWPFPGLPAHQGTHRRNSH